MLVPLSPVVAADEPSSQPTIEEILNGYHQKAFEERNAEQNGTASTYSRRSGSEKTLEQETVDELTAAGYEAYNVTADNYDDLEESLRTDFSALGIERDGSYIVVVGGDESTASNNASSRTSDGVLPPHTDLDDENLSNTFYYTYQGKRFLMRFITVTKADKAYYGQSDSYDLTKTEFETKFEEFLNAVISTYADSMTKKIQVGTILSLSGVEFVSFDRMEDLTMLFIGSTNWTRVYTEIYNSDHDVWLRWSSVEYARQSSRVVAEYYDSETNAYVEGDTDAVVKYVYTEHYFDYTYRKEMAARAWFEQWPIHELTGNCYYYYNDEVIITHPEVF